MTEPNVDKLAHALVEKIKHYLITHMGVTAERASAQKFYRAFAMALREELMVNWTASTLSFRKKQARVLYYICMEYMPGRFTGNNITNIFQNDMMMKVLKAFNRNPADVFCFEPDPGLGNGGLGRLAACLLDSLATQQYPAIGYGLRYQYGIFDQEIWGGVQVERPDVWLLYENPWEFRRDDHSAIIHYGGNSVEVSNSVGEKTYELHDADEIRALSYDIPIIGCKKEGDYSIATLRLWTTKESPKNFALQKFNAGQLDEAAENSALTDVLYPNDNNEVGKRIRLKQEYLLVAASVQDILLHYSKNYPDMNSFVDKVRIQLNDTHPALTVPHLILLLTRNHNMKFDEAFEVTKAVCSYTNHTILREALEEWNVDRLKHLLPCEYHIIERINQKLCTEVREKYPHDEEKVRRMSLIENGQARMAQMSIYGTHAVNGVAALHTEIIKRSLFEDFYQMFPERFINVTNGVTQRRWLLHANPKLANFITKRIGDGWVRDFEQMEKLREFASDKKSQEEFLQIKKENKHAFMEYMQRQNAIRNESGKVLDHSHVLHEDALFDMHVKRIHEYKRQTLNALHLIILYRELKENPNSRKIKRMSFFAGKAAPGYKMAKNIIQLVYAISRKVDNDPAVKSKLEVAFVENYNVSRAEIMIPAADLSEQISTAGFEASGTGNMKFSMNGALTIGTDDGANVEMREGVTNQWWPFLFGASSEENEKMYREGTYDPKQILESDPKIKGALEMLVDGSLAEKESETEAFRELYNALTEIQGSQRADYYFVLKDMQSYYETQKKVEELYQQPNKWAEFALHNIAGMGKFSTDVSINNYASKIWHLDKVPVDAKILQETRELYHQNDIFKMSQ